MKEIERQEQERKIIQFNVAKEEILRQEGYDRRGAYIPRQEPVLKGNDNQSEFDQTRINEIERRERQRKSDKLNLAKEETQQQEGTDRTEDYIPRQNITLKEGYYNQKIIR